MDETNVRVFFFIRISWNSIIVHRCGAVTTYQFISLWNHEGRQFPVNEIQCKFRELQQDSPKNPFARISSGSEKGTVYIQIISRFSPNRFDTRYT